MSAAVDRFYRSGIDGIECFYVTHTREQTERLATQCARLDLLSTGSSDFHGPEHPEDWLESIRVEGPESRPDCRLT